MAGSNFWRQLRAIVILPGVATLVVPSAILIDTWDAGRDAAASPLLRFSRWGLGALVVVIGLSLMLRSIGLFSAVGEGTLAPWDPTRKLVVRGIYRYVRNPMISGVSAVLLGEAVLFGSRPLLWWFLGFVAANALWIPFVEERGLVKRFGEEYREYRRHVPRWLPRLRPWEPGNRQG